MRYATPTRSAHHAVPMPSLLAVRRPAGQHRQPARHLRREPYRTGRLLTHGLAALIVLGICVMVGVLIVADQRRAPAAPSSDQLISSRLVDPAPLTVAEVFPAGTTFQADHPRLTADCSVAVTGALRQVLQEYECSQSISAALTVPYADYAVTAGVLNLPDTGSATAVGDQVRQLVVTGDGGFAGPAGDQTPPGSPVVWRTRGHYLLYCVITRPDGAPVPTDDPATARITAEILDQHLHNTVLTPRAS